MTATRYVFEPTKLPSRQWMLASLYEYLFPIAKGDTMARFKVAGMTDDGFYDVTADHPQSAGDFTAGCGRITVEVASSKFADCDRLMQASLTLSAYAHCRPDSGFLAEHAGNLLACWDMRYSKNCCIQRINSISIGATRFNDAKQLHRTNVLFQAIVS